MELLHSNDRRSARSLLRHSECTYCKGFTLFELLLVLALIVVMGGIIVPVLSGSFVYTKLNSAADDVQSAWANARLEAIERGQPVAFRCLVGGTEFTTTLYYPGIESETPDPEATTETTPLKGSLDEDLKFSEAISANALDGSDPGLRTNMRETTGWSAPVIFYPDGLSSDAFIRIAHKDGRGIAVSLRGLTGIGRKGEVGPSGVAVEEER